MDSKLPVAVMSGMGAIISGERIAAGEALTRLAQQPHLVCHAAFLVERLGLAAGANRAAIRAAREQRHCDVAELFAFVCPARFATPTPAGLARSLALQPDDSDAETLTLIADDLLQRLANRHYPLIRETAETATFLARANWPWAKPVIAALLKANPKLDVGNLCHRPQCLGPASTNGRMMAAARPAASEAVAPDEAQAFLGEIAGARIRAAPAADATMPPRPPSPSRRASART